MEWREIIPVAVTVGLILAVHPPLVRSSNFLNDPAVSV